MTVEHKKMSTIVLLVDLNFSVIIIILYKVVYGIYI